MKKQDSRWRSLSFPALALSLAASAQANHGSESVNLLQQRSRAEGIELVPVISRVTSHYARGTHYLRRPSKYTGYSEGKLLFLPGEFRASASGREIEGGAQLSEPVTMDANDARDREAAACMADQNRELRAALSRARRELGILGVKQVRVGIWDNRIPGMDACLAMFGVSVYRGTFRQEWAFAYNGGNSVGDSPLDCGGYELRLKPEGMDFRGAREALLRADYPRGDHDVVLEVKALLGAPAASVQVENTWFEQELAKENAAYQKAMSSRFPFIRSAAKQPVAPVPIAGPLGCRVVSTSRILEVLRSKAQSRARAVQEAGKMASQVRPDGGSGTSAWTATE